MPQVGWQQSALEWGEDASDDCVNYPQVTQPIKLSKKQRKAAKKAAKRAARVEAEQRVRRLSELRQVTLDDAPGHKLRLIFTDFDGVLNQHSSGAYELRAEQVERLDRLARETDAVVVVSSWWRWIGVSRLRLDLASAGFHGRLIGRTPWLGETEQWDARERGTEVAAVLAYLGDRVESFVILDDHNRMGDLLPHLVQTTATEGLTENDCARAARILLPRPVKLVQPMYPSSLTRESASTYTTHSVRDGA